MQVNHERNLRVLFVCVENTFRSQMAEALMKAKYGDVFEVESAGLRPGTLHPLAIKVMQKEGIDISDNVTNNVFDFYKEGRLYRYVITVCSREAEKECPIFPGIRRRINWPLDNPAALEGTDEEKYKNALKIRNEIAHKVDELVASLNLTQ